MDDRAQILASLIRDRARRAYNVAAELRKLAAELEAVVRETSQEDTHGTNGQGSTDVEALVAGRPRS